MKLILADEDDDGGSHGFKLSQHNLKRLLLDDPNWEVRLHTLSFLSSVLERLALVDTHLMNWIFQVKCQELLSEMTKDSSRVVRAESVNVISKVLSLSSVLNNAAYVECLASIDLGSVRDLSQVEYIYEEALDVGKSLIQENDPLNEGNNVMHCYDC
ncbi:hypothetical protein BDR26DRAFT_535842 [Obelidium mucronatum]|nr:hypothetical protein BDR26DRAFT_535842 [Obelidium mucronatum]